MNLFNQFLFNISNYFISQMTSIIYEEFFSEKYEHSRSFNAKLLKDLGLNIIVEKLLKII